MRGLSRDGVGWMEHQSAVGHTYTHTERRVKKKIKEYGKGRE